jgi:hypothetical protein
MKSIKIKSKVQLFIFIIKFSIIFLFACCLLPIYLVEFFCLRLVFIFFLVLVDEKL